MKSNNVIRSIVSILMIAATLGACDVETYDDAASGFGGSSPPPPPPPPPGPPPPPPPPGGFNPVFSEVQANVFTPDCATSGCHSGGAPSAGLNLEAANSYAELVGIGSAQDMGIQRVAQNDPDNSYLIMKLEGTAATGLQMPIGAPALDQSVIDIVRQWITDGAIDDTVLPPPPDPDPVRVTSLSPTPAQQLDTGPSQIVAGFDVDLDASTVNANTFLLIGSVDGIFNNGNDVTITAASVSVPGVNPRSAVFDLTGVNLADDLYQVRLLGTGASIIMDINGNALDGEFGGAFPSGNTVQGGDFIANFSVVTPVQIGPTLDQIQTVVFGPSCASAACHDANQPAANLSLTDADTSFLNLVGVAATQDAAIQRMNAGNPDMSYLIMKLEANPPNGQQMPIGGAPLDAVTIGHIRDWITNGALR